MQMRTLACKMKIWPIDTYNEENLWYADLVLTYS